VAALLVTALVLAVVYCWYRRKKEKSIVLHEENYSSLEMATEGLTSEDEEDKYHKIDSPSYSEVMTPDPNNKDFKFFFMDEKDDQASTPLCHEENPVPPSPALPEACLSLSPVSRTNTLSRANTHNISGIRELPDENMYEEFAKPEDQPDDAPLPSVSQLYSGDDPLSPVTPAEDRHRLSVSSINYQTHAFKPTEEVNSAVSDISNCFAELKNKNKKGLRLYAMNPKKSESLSVRIYESPSKANEDCERRKGGEAAAKSYHFRSSFTDLGMDLGPLAKKKLTDVGDLDSSLTKLRNILEGDMDDNLCSDEKDENDYEDVRKKYRDVTASLERVLVAASFSKPFDSSINNSSDNVFFEK